MLSDSDNRCGNKNSNLSNLSKLTEYLPSLDWTITMTIYITIQFAARRYLKLGFDTSDCFSMYMYYKLTFTTFLSKFWEHR